MINRDPIPSPDQQEISSDDIRVFAEKVRQVAPYIDQPVDDFGSYVTNFAFDNDDYVSIYVPVVADFAGEDALIDDAVRVLVRMENPLGDGRSIVTTKNYIVHELDGEADYSETTRIHDTETGVRLDRLATASLEDVMSLYSTNQQLGATIFTRERFVEVMGILNTLKPEDILPA